MPHASRFFRLFLSLAVVAGSLAACEKQLTSPLLDFIATTNSLTGDRIISAPDTFEVRTFAEARENDPALARFTITAQEEKYFKSPTQDKFDDNERVYFDTVFTPSTVTRYLFINRFGASASRGQQRWVYTITDASGNVARRSYRIISRPADSVRALHSYSVRLQAPRSAGSRASLALARGFVLPPIATKQVDYHELVDLVYVPTTTGPSLAAPSAAQALTAPFLKIARWQQRRATALGTTSVSATAFASITTADAVTSAVSAATLTASSALPVAKNQVIAFRTTEGQEGLLLIRDVGTIAPVDLIIDIKLRRF